MFKTLAVWRKKDSAVLSGDVGMVPVQKHLSLLGLKVRDKVTCVEGVVATIGFDLYGCVQAIVNCGVDKEGKLKDQLWFDVARLEVLDSVPVMTPPNFHTGPQAEGLQGCDRKPFPHRA